MSFVEKCPQCGKSPNLRQDFKIAPSDFYKSETFFDASLNFSCFGVSECALQQDFNFCPFYFLFLDFNFLFEISAGEISCRVCLFWVAGVFSLVMSQFSLFSFILTRLMFFL